MYPLAYKVRQLETVKPIQINPFIYGYILRVEEDNDSIILSSTASHTLNQVEDELTANGFNNILVANSETLIKGIDVSTYRKLDTL